MLNNPKVKSIFSLHIGPYNFVSDITRFKLFSKPLDKNRITFRRYEEGVGVKWTLEVGAVFDGGSEGSLHDYLWSNAGSTAEFIIKPYQEFDPANKRFYQGMLRISQKPDLAVTVAKTSVYTYKFEVIGQPTRSDSPSGLLTGEYFDEY